MTHGSTTWITVAKAAEDAQSCRNGYWQPYEESQREYPAEIFPEGVDG
jgi:hypothetical protein